jgi:hypothetical protein
MLQAYLVSIYETENRAALWGSDVSFSLFVRGQGSKQSRDRTQEPGNLYCIAPSLVLRPPGSSFIVCSVPVLGAIRLSPLVTS